MDVRAWGHGSAITSSASEYPQGALSFGDLILQWRTITYAIHITWSNAEPQSNALYLISSTNKDFCKDNFNIVDFSFIFIALLLFFTCFQFFTSVLLCALGYRASVFCVEAVWAALRIFFHASRALPEFVQQIRKSPLAGLLEARRIFVTLKAGSVQSAVWSFKWL